MRKMNRRSYLRSSLFITGGLALPSLNIANSLAGSEAVVNSGSQSLGSGIDGDRINPLPPGTIFSGVHFAEIVLNLNKIY
jgi:hypothetical protein